MLFVEVPTPVACYVRHMGLVQGMKHIQDADPETL